MHVLSTSHCNNENTSLSHSISPHSYIFSPALPPLLAQFSEGHYYYISIPLLLSLFLSWGLECFLHSSGVDSNYIHHCGVFICMSNTLALSPLCWNQLICWITTNSREEFRGQSKQHTVAAAIYTATRPLRDQTTGTSHCDSVEIMKGRFYARHSKMSPLWLFGLSHIRIRGKPQLIIMVKVSVKSLCMWKCAWAICSNLSHVNSFC